MATLPSRRSTYVPRFETAVYVKTLEQDELAMVQDNLSSSIIGEMRMQFWRDTVKGVTEVRRPLMFCLVGYEHDLG